MIGIIVAEEKELIEIKKYLYNIDEINLYEKTFYKGYIKDREVILVKSNVGKVNASRICQMLIDNFKISIIINVGTAGSVDNKLEIGDIVVSNRLIQYDFDVTPFGRKLGEIENIGQYIDVEKKFLEIFNDLNVYIGCIATGDKFIVNNNEKNLIRKELDALCIEMEGASIAQVCKLDNIPFLIIRSITDKLDGSSTIEFCKFLESSSKKVAALLNDIIDKLPTNNKEKQTYLSIPTQSDLDYYENLLQDEKTMSYNAGYDINLSGYDKESGCINFFDKEKWYLKQQNDKNRFFAYIITKQNNNPIGYVNISFDNDYLKHCCGIVIESKHRQLGYGKEALKELLNIAFNEYKVKSLINKIPYNRVGALKLFTKLGFKVIDEYYIKKFNSNERIVIVELTKEDYYKNNM